MTFATAADLPKSWCWYTNRCSLHAKMCLRHPYIHLLTCTMTLSLMHISPVLDRNKSRAVKAPTAQLPT